MSAIGAGKALKLLTETEQNSYQCDILDTTNVIIYYIKCSGMFHSKETLKETRKHKTMYGLIT